jgi:hypothetical protein
VQEEEEDQGMRKAAFEFTITVSLLSLNLLAGRMSAQIAHQDPQIQQQIRSAVEIELAADRDDHSRWQYRSLRRRPEGESLYLMVETDHGSVKKKIQQDGKPLSQDELGKENQRIDSFVHDESQLAKQRKDSEQDDKRAESMLRMLPDAFLWTVKSDAPDGTTYSFVPNPDFDPPTMESRVFAAMAGDIVVSKPEKRIQRITGKLIRDVKFGYGLLGKMEQGGTFSVERRSLAPKVWQITESHVHINGHILLFKTITEQEDEVKTEFKPTPAGTTLEQAAGILRNQPSSSAIKR